MVHIEAKRIDGSRPAIYSGKRYRQPCHCKRHEPEQHHGCGNYLDRHQRDHAAGEFRNHKLKLVTLMKTVIPLALIGAAVFGVYWYFSGKSTSNNDDMGGNLFGITDPNW